MKRVFPVTYKVGETVADSAAITQYLADTNQLEFLASWQDALAAGIPSGVALCSFYAKLCYAALTDKHNQNISRVRDIADNIAGTLEHGHGSVFEHCTINYVTTNCSRVFTHELVRHRAGTAFSQTSGRYVRPRDPAIVWDPVLDPIKHLADDLMQSHTQFINAATDMLGLNDPKMPFSKKKKLTSALRRFGFNGQANEMGWSANLRTLRHLIMLRTNESAEWEIRAIFNDVYRIMKEAYPIMFADAKERVVDGLVEVHGMKLQPYEKIAEADSA